MTVISEVAPHPSKNNPLITSEQEHVKLIAQEVKKTLSLILPLAALVAQYAHKTSLTDWHTALNRLGMLPKQIPPLRLTQKQIHEGVCPQLRGSFYLIPSGTLNALEAKVKAYGETHLDAFGGKNPLQFRSYWEPARRDLGDIQYPKYEWRWMSDDIVSGSRNQDYHKQGKIVADLGENFKIPSLREVAACFFLNKVATENSLLQHENVQNGGVRTYTNVEDTAGGSRLAFGSSDPSGVCVDFNGSYTSQNIGAVALWRPSFKSRWV